MAVQIRTKRMTTRSKSNQQLLQNSERSEEVSSTTIILPSEESVPSQLTSSSNGGTTTSSASAVVTAASAGPSSSQTTVANKEIKKVLTTTGGASAKKQQQLEGSKSASGSNASTAPGPASGCTSGSSSSGGLTGKGTTAATAAAAAAAAIKEQESFTAADSNSGNSPAKSFVPCKVCGDKASGYHYGVTSCEGCKGFFRRSIQKQIEYRCLRDGKCLVIRLNRNRCQYCRFKKCLAVGMSRDSVRYGRVPKRTRERGGSENRVTQSEADQSARDLENKQLAMYDIILTISQAHHANCAYTEEKTRGIIRKPAIFVNSNLYDFQGCKVEQDSLDGSPTSVTSVSSVTPDSLEQQKIVMWQHFAVLVTPSIQRVVEFAKRIPGFLDLTQDDQLIMIKTGFFEIWLIHVSRMINSLDNTLTFSDGSYITRQQMEVMFDYEFVSGIFNFMVMFNNLQLNDTEIGIFGAIVLLQSERSGIYDTKAIDHNQEKLMEALKLQVGRNHASDSHIFSTLMANMSELRSLGFKHAEHLQWFKANWTLLKLPPLFAEIFDIPKSEEDYMPKSEPDYLH